MPIINEQDFFSIQQLDLENKLFSPTAQLFSQVRFQLNNLYQDIQNTLIDAHSMVASSAKQVYDQPVPTITAWYEQAKNSGAALLNEAQTNALPAYHNMLAQWSTGKAHALQHFRSFWDNPEQTVLTALEPVIRYTTTASAKAGHTVQLFLDNPEQFMAAALAPVTAYLTSFTENSKAVLISTYHALTDLFNLLATQPLTALQTAYHGTLSALLDVYFNVISSFLTMA
jgi:hypothetical protein